MPSLSDTQSLGLPYKSIGHGETETTLQSSDDLVDNPQGRPHAQGSLNVFAKTTPASPPHNLGHNGM